MATRSRPEPRTVTVFAKQQVSPAMLRVSIGGDGLDGFPLGSEGGYIKLHLRPDGTDGPVVVRTYTIRQQRANVLDIDFVLHRDAAGEHGPAMQWAMDCAIGDTVEIGGPGPAKPLPEGAEFYLLAGDMTALPAISVNLEALAPDARGHAIIEVQGEEDRQDFALPPGFTVEYVINPAPGTGADAMVERVRAAWSETGEVYGWVASEFTTMRALRDLLRGEYGLGSDRLYISSYWKAGLIEDEHKVVKREDSERAG